MARKPGKTSKSGTRSAAKKGRKAKAKAPAKRAKPLAKRGPATARKGAGQRGTMRREVVHVPGGREHKNPVPACIKMGNLVFSASIAGQDPATDRASPDPATQIALAFVNLRKTVEAAGGTPANIARINFYVPDMGQRTHINREWLAMFPDENDRPVRKVYPSQIPEGLFLQMDFIAVL